MSTDPNSSVLSMPGTPLKAIDNICSSAVAGNLDDSGNGASIIGTDQPTFLRPQQTSTPASRKTSPRKVVPLMKLVPTPTISLLVPLPDGGFEKRSAVLSRVVGPVPVASCSLPDGGFMPESQPLGLTPVVPVQRVVKEDVVDLTVEEDTDAVSESQFKPTLVSTQMCAEPVNTAGRLSELPSRIGNFENSFAGNDGTVTEKFKPVAASTQVSPEAHTSGVAENHRSKHMRIGDFENSFVGNDGTFMVAEDKFKPAAVSTQVSPSGGLCNHQSKLCPRNSFASETLANGKLGGDSGNRKLMETGSGSVDAAVCRFLQTKDGIDSKSCHTSVHDPSQQLASRSPSPELFDGEDAETDKVEVVEFKPPPNTDSSPTTQDLGHKATGLDHQASLVHATLAQKLANRKLKAEDGTATDHGGRDQDPLKSGTVLSELKSGPNASLAKAAEKGCSQMRRSARLSTRSKMSLNGSRLRSRGVDFVDEIDEVAVLTFSAILKEQLKLHCLFHSTVEIKLIPISCILVHGCINL